MRLTKLSMKERRRRKIGAACEYQLDIDHLGVADAWPIKATVYLGPSQVMELWDLLDSAAPRERDAVTVQLWDDVMATVERLQGEYADLPEDPAGLIEEDEVLVRWGEARGRAQGLAFALALLANPRHPDIEAIRAESVERWEAQ